MLSLILQVCIMVVGIFLMIVMIAERRRILFFMVLLNVGVVFLADRGVGFLKKLPGTEPKVFSERSIHLRKNLPHLDYYETAHYYTNRPLEKQRVKFQTDAQGFLLPSKIHEHADVTLVFLGGSTTECRLVQHTNRFPYVVGRLLEEKTGLKVNSYNSGRAGNHTLHSINILINEVIPLKPDRVVLMHALNDMTILLYERSYWNNHRTRAPIKATHLVWDHPPTLLTLVRDSVRWVAPHLYTRVASWNRPPIVLDEWAHRRKETIIYNTQSITETFADNLRLFVAICRSRAIEPVLMTQANRLCIYPDSGPAERVKPELVTIPEDDFIAIYAALHETTREVAKALGVMLIELERGILKTSEYIYDPVHYTDKGSLAAADLIVEKLYPVYASGVQADR